jgi:hypothetical protein
MNGKDENARPNLGTHTRLIQDSHLLGYDMFGKWFLMFGRVLMLSCSR